jgi:hypothetical protein
MEGRMTHEPDVDELIAKYRAEIAAEAELARGDLDEIEDHLRSLVTDLRNAGMPLADAIVVAAQRLGQPRELAREHSRVRSAFGARLSRTRAWSAAAMLAMVIVCTSDRYVSRGLFTTTSLHLLAWIGLVAALVARRSWVRGLVLGMVSATLIVQVTHVVDLMSTSDFFGDRIFSSMIKAGVAGGSLHELLVQCALLAAAIAFIAPWRLCELSRRGVALALLGAANTGGLRSLTFYADLPHALVVNPLGALAFAAVAIAIIGAVRSTPWGSLAAGIAGCALGALAVTALAGNAYVILGDRHVANEVGGVALLGALAALGASIALWRDKLAAIRRSRLA